MAKITVFEWFRWMEGVACQWARLRCRPATLDPPLHHLHQSSHRHSIQDLRDYSASGQNDLKYQKWRNFFEKRSSVAEFGDGAPAHPSTFCSGAKTLWPAPAWSPKIRFAADFGAGHTLTPLWAMTSYASQAAAPSVASVYSAGVILTTWGIGT